MDEVDGHTYELPVKHPNSNEKVSLRDTTIIKKDLTDTFTKSTVLLSEISKKLNNIFDDLLEKHPIFEIKDVCKVIAGQSPEGKFYNKSGKGLPFYQGKKEFTSRNVGNPTTWTTKVTKEAIEGDILMSVRAPVGPVNFSTQNICIGRGLAAIRATKKIDKEYLIYYFLKHEDEIVGKEGMGFNSINKSQIEKLKIPIPPIDIQKIIVKSLNEMTQKLEQLELMQAHNDLLIKELKKSILKKAFEA